MSEDRYADDWEVSVSASEEVELDEDDGGGEGTDEQSQSQSHQEVDDDKNDAFQNFPSTEVMGIYAPQVRFRRKREMEAMSLLPLPPRIVGGLKDQLEKTKQCNCKRSNCLKVRFLGFVSQ
jgi:hypothetical protein